MKICRSNGDFLALLMAAPEIRMKIHQPESKCSHSTLTFFRLNAVDPVTLFPSVWGWQFSSIMLNNIGQDRTRIVIIITHSWSHDAAPDYFY